MPARAFPAVVLVLLAAGCQLASSPDAPVRVDASETAADGGTSPGCAALVDAYCVGDVAPGAPAACGTITACADSASCSYARQVSRDAPERCAEFTVQPPADWERCCAFGNSAVVPADCLRLVVVVCGGTVDAGPGAAGADGGEPRACGSTAPCTAARDVAASSDEAACRDAAGDIHAFPACTSP